MWNYIRVEMDRLEKHFFRLLRRTLFLAKYDTTYLKVLNTARVQSVIKLYPLECYVQRQQLKFLWKILHLNDLALQRIVLHSKLDAQFSRGRGGRKRTYKQCIKDAMSNFGVTMAQCMDMEQQDWDLRIEEIGLETALQQWEGRPKASKSIDKEWRTAVSRKQRQQASTPTVEPIDGVDRKDAEVEEGSNGGSDTDCDTEDELAQFLESQAEMDGGADEGEDATPLDGDAHTADRDEGAPTQRTRARRIRSHGIATDTTEKQGCVVEQRRAAEERYGNATGAHQDGQSLEE
jgi:hypothetical protein